MLSTTILELQAGRGKGMGKLSMWSDKIVTHFWYCCQSCGSDLEVLKASNVGLCAVSNFHGLCLYPNHVDSLDFLAPSCV